MSWLSQRMGWDPNQRKDSWLWGGGAKAIVPEDVRGLRAQQIQLLMSLLRPGAFGAGGAGQGFFGVDAFSTAPSPETQTFNTARPILEGMLTGTGPQFERDIASANQQGGRFSSGNAILRGEALRNLFNQRTQTAGTLGVLAGQAGASQFQKQNQLMQLMAGLLGLGGQATLSLPVENDRGAFGDLLKIFATLAASGGGGAPPA